LNLLKNMKINKKTLMVTGVFLLAAIFVISYFAITLVTARVVVTAPVAGCPAQSGSCTAGEHKCVEGTTQACKYECTSGGTWGAGTECTWNMCDGGNCGGEGSISVEAPREAGFLRSGDTSPRMSTGGLDHLA
jgi:hypothetical protein